MEPRSRLEFFLDLIANPDTYAEGFPFKPESKIEQLLGILGGLENIDFVAETREEQFLIAAVGALTEGGGGE